MALQLITARPQVVVKVVAATQHLQQLHRLQQKAGGAGGAAPSSTTQEPVIAPVTSTLAPAAASNAPVTTDGSCGVSNGGTVCGNWPNGNCCSMYGFW